MNKKIIIFLTSAIFLAVPAVILALDPVPFPADVGNTDIWLIADKVLGFIWPLFIVVATLMFLVAGFMFVTANGDPAKIATGKKAVVGAAIGIVVAILAFSAVDIITELIAPKYTCQISVAPQCGGTCPAPQACWWIPNAGVCGCLNAK